ncbi:MAG: GNAT family N-acetyltransferase [Alphaproteobacteria bacterium]|nr:GNAT family N-acetyltransferase [Alphaproteobacteria bacterium]
MKIRAESDTESAAVSDFVETELLRALAASNVQSENTQIVLSIRDEANAIVAGVTASTAYGWLLIKTLWVREDQRGNGLGRQLMQTVEARGRELGCHGAWLDTSSGQARAFYEAQGFETFGKLSNMPDQFPGDHRRWFMKRAL